MCSDLLVNKREKMLAMFAFFYNNNQGFNINCHQCHKANPKLARKIKVIYTKLKKSQEIDKNIH
jgi:hypothetical protein